MAGEKTAHRPPSRLALSPPSKIKAPCRFSLSPGKNPSLCEIPYQSPKKCLKTQITTFSILKFSPKAKNTPVLTVFTLFLLFVSSFSCLCHRHSVTVIIPLYTLLSCFSCLLKIPRGETHQPIIVYLPLFAIIIVYLPLQISILKFHRPLTDSEIPEKTILKVPQKSHKNDLFCSFFLSLFWFFKVFFCDNCFELFCSTGKSLHFSFTISFISPDLFYFTISFDSPDFLSFTISVISIRFFLSLFSFVP